MPDRKVGRTVVDGPQLRSLLVKMVRAMSANEIAEVLLEAYGPVKCATIADALREERERDGKAERELAALRERVRSGACCHKCGQAVLDPACIFCGAPHTPPEPDPMHPYGRCSCAGEGRCEWCVEAR